MTVTFAERAAAYRDAARRVHDIEVSERPEPDRLQDIRRILVALGRRTELFPPSAFPRTPGESGGLFRLAHSPDGRGGLYVSLGFTGRGGGQPHTHGSWAAVVGVSGGTETNFLYDRADDGQFVLRDAVEVGPGDAILLPTGAYHTIAVVSDTPVLHVHAYGHPAGPSGFSPPLPVIASEEARAEARAGRAAVVALDPSLAHVLGDDVLVSSPEAVIEALDWLGLDAAAPVILAGPEDAISEASARLYEAGYAVIFRLEAEPIPA